MERRNGKTSRRPPRLSPYPVMINLEKGARWTMKHFKGHLVGSERKSWNSVPLDKDMMSSRR